MSKTIGIVGSRRRNNPSDYGAILTAFEMIYERGDAIVSGGCPQGGDRFAEMIARKYNLTIDNGKLIIHYADWERYGKAAGMIRNAYIATDADVVIACVAADRTGGTEDTIKKATRLGRKIVLV